MKNPPAKNYYYYSPVFATNSKETGSPKRMDVLLEKALAREKAKGTRDDVLDSVSRAFAEIPDLRKESSLEELRSDYRLDSRSSSERKRTPTGKRRSVTDPKSSRKR